MNDQSSSHDDPQWLNEFEELANRQLEDGSSCDQVHPIVERWFDKLLQSDPPASRPSVEQAMACLATEILNRSPEELVESVLQQVDEDELGAWVEHVLLIGRAFETALRKGDFDDL